MMMDRGEPLTGVPIYLHRRFRHQFVFVNAAAGIRQAKDLNGKIVGSTNFQPASNIWMRGILEDEYGLDHRSITWLVERSEDVSFAPPPDLRIEMKTTDKPLSDMLADGDIPAMISPTLPRPFVEGDQRIVRLFPNHKDIEIAYFRRTGIFPIMHVTTVKRDVWSAIPGSRPISSRLSRNRNSSRTSVWPILAWCRSLRSQRSRRAGGAVRRDPWSYGLTGQNRKNLETVQRYCHRQALIKTMRPLDQLFADTDLSDAAGAEEF